MATQLMLGHLPLLLHPNPKRVLVIGLGSGVTAGAVAQHPVVREIDVVELEPAVVVASRHFVEENRNVLSDPRVRLVVGDGRNYILASEKRYDVISSVPSNPWMAGVANLFSREFYQLARGRLADDGIMIQWVHGYSLFPRDLRMIVKTFMQSFPHATLWRTLRGDYLLVGARSALRVDYALLERRIAASPAAREDMASIWLASPLDALTLSFLDDTDLARFAQGAPENTDENHRLLRESRKTEFPPVDNLPDGLLEARRVHFARIYWAAGKREEALDQLRKAPWPDSRDVASHLDRSKLVFSLGEVGQATERLAALARGRSQDRLIASYLKAGAILRELKAEEAVSEHGPTRLGDPNPAEAHNNLGNAYFELQRLGEAATAYRRVLVLKPGIPQTHFNLVYERQGALEAAAREYRVALSLQPSWALPRPNLQRLGALGAPAR